MWLGETLVVRDSVQLGVTVKLVEGVNEGVTEGDRLGAPDGAWLGDMFNHVEGVVEGVTLGDSDGIGLV